MSVQNMDRNQEELKQQATEQNASDAQNIHPQEVAKAVEEGVAGAYQKIEEGVVGSYKKIEDAVVGSYKKIEEGVVDGFTKITDKFVEKLFTREGETVEEAKKRMNGESRNAGK